MFEKAGMEVVTAINGYQAFEIVSKQTGNSGFDLVILDLNMPISDGYDACRKITRMFKQD